MTFLSTLIYALFLAVAMRTSNLILRDLTDFRFATLFSILVVLVIGLHNLLMGYSVFRVCFFGFAMITFYAVELLIKRSPAAQCLKYGAIQVATLVVMALSITL